MLRTSSAETSGGCDDSVGIVVRQYRTTVLRFATTYVIVAWMRPPRRAIFSGVATPGSAGVLHSMLRPDGTHTFRLANRAPSASNAHGSPALLSQEGLLRHSGTYSADRRATSSRKSTENARTAAVFSA